jgi:hypothetical protein
MSRALRPDPYTHFGRAKRVVFAIVDMVSRKWIDTLVSVEETATQVQVVFEHALEAEGLLELLTDERLDLAVDDPARPTRSGARQWPLPGRVVPRRRRVGRPTRPSSRMIAATVFSLTRQPLSRRSSVIRGAP